MLLTWCGAELCGPHLACGGYKFAALCIWDTTQGETILCGSSAPKPPCSHLSLKGCRAWSCLCRMQGAGVLQGLRGSAALWALALE